MQFTPTQEQVLDLVNKSIADNERLFVLWYGGIRAGKTYGMVYSAVKHSTHHEDKNYIVGGYTLRSIINNVVPYFKEVSKEFDLPIKVVEGGINPRAEIGDNRFLFYGGDKMGRDKNIQGATAIGLIVDEFELVNRDFLKQCEGRISNDGALRIYTSNKGQPYSWAKKEYYDRAEKGEIEAILVDSNPEENTFISEDFWKEKETEYDSYYKRRFLSNDFASVSEPVYDVTYVDMPIEDTPESLTMIYSYGKHHFSIPFYMVDGRYIIGNVKEETSPVDVEGITRKGVVLVNHTANMLARECLSHKIAVRGYSDTYVPHKYELSQRAFSGEKVVVLEDAEHTKECLETYHFAGLTENPEINAIESGIEYLTRFHRWE